MKQLLRFKTFLILALLAMVGNSAWTQSTSTLTFSAKCNGSGTADDGVSWTVTSDGIESNFDNNKGIHYGTGSQQVQYIKLSTSQIEGTITSVVVNASTASGVSATVDVTVGGEAFGDSPQSLSASAANYTFNGSASGAIVVTVTKPSKATKAIYVKSVAVTYTSGGTSTLKDNDLALTDAPVALSFDLYNNATPQVISYTTSSTGDISVGNNDYATFEVDQTNKTITVTPTAETPSTQTITVIQAAGDTYAAGSVTFTLDITDSTPVGDVSEDVIDFTAQSYTNQQTIEKFEADGCTISFDKGTNSNAPKYFTTGTAIRAYGGNTFTVTSTCGKSISEIIITFGNSDGSNEITANVGTYSDGTWTGDAESVTFTIGGTSGNRRIAGIKVTYADAGDTRVATTTTFPQASYAIELGDEFTAPTATVKVGEEEVTGAEVTYSGDNDALAAVDATTGSLTFVDGATGEINVTATYAGDETNYKGSTGTYTLTVTDPNGPGTENNPYTVAEARAAIDAGTGMTGVYAKGIVSEIVTAYNSKYGNITYNISADGTTTADQLQAFRGKSYNGEVFTSEDDIQVGDEVVVYGNLKKYGETYEFDTNNQLVSLQRPVVTTPSIGLSTTTVNAEAAAANGTIGVTYANFTAANPGIELFEADGTTPATYDWLTASFDDDATIVYSIQENTTTEARTAYFKAYAMNGETKVYSDLVTVAQAGVVIDYATLPFSFDGGKADVEGTNGLTHEGLGSDYSTAPKLKFDTTGDALVLKFNERPGKLTFDIKGNGFSGGTFTVQTSEDGVTYTDLETYDALTDMQSEELNNLGEGVRYIKWVYTNKSSGNVALGNIALAKYSAPAPSITLPGGYDYTMDAKAGGGEIPVVSENLASDPQLAVVFVEADGVTPATYDWITATINNNGNIYGHIETNTGAERTAYFYVTGKDADNNDVYSNLVTFTQEAPVAATPTIVFNPESIDFDANSGYRTIGGDYFQLKDFDSTPSLEILYYESDGDTEKQGGYDWLTADFNSNNQIDFTWGTNTGAARTAYLKIHAVGTTVYSNLFTVNQAGVVVDYATLPFSFDGGKADIEGTNGLTHEGLGSDYSTAPKLRFDTTGDALVLKFNERPGKLTFDIKGNGFSGGTFTVQTSEDGVNYTDLKTYTELGATQSEKFNTLGENVRYIKWVYTEKSSGNVALGNIALEKYTDTPVVVVAAPTFNPAGGEVAAGTEVTLSAPEASMIVYTTDGTAPSYVNSNGEVYTTPIVVNADMTIKAIAVDDNENESEVVSATYTVAAEEVEGVKYYKVTSTDQLEEGVDYLLVYEGVAGEGAAAYGGLDKYTTNSYGKSVDLKHIGGSVVTITDEAVVPVTLKSRSEDGTKWAMRDANGWIAAVDGNNLHGDKTEDDAVWTFDFTAEAHKQIYHEFSGNTDTRYLEYNTNNPRFAGYTGTQSAVYLYKAASYNVSVGATGYATLYYGTKNLVVPEGVEAYTYTVSNGKLEESYMYSPNEVIPAGTGVILKASTGEYKFTVTEESGLEDSDNLLFGFDEASTTVAPAAGDYLFYLLGVDNGKVGFYWGKDGGAAFTSGAHKAYLAVPTEQASGLRGFSFDGSVVGINTIGIDMPEGNAYDLQGRRVQQFQKNGLYIVDGKKMLAK